MALTFSIRCHKDVESYTDGGKCVCVWKGRGGAALHWSEYTAAKKSVLYDAKIATLQAIESKFPLQTLFCARLACQNCFKLQLYKYIQHMVNIVLHYVNVVVYVINIVLKLVNTARNCSKCYSNDEL